jgi:hypothetical protein
MVPIVDAGKRLFAGERSASYVHEAELHGFDSLTPDRELQSRGRGSKRVLVVSLPDEGTLGAEWAGDSD